MSLLIPAMEIVGGRWSVIIGIGLEFPWAVGYIALAGIAYRVPDWSELQLAISGTTTISSRSKIFQYYLIVVLFF